MYTLTWILQSILWIPGQLVLRFFFGYRVSGTEHLRGLKKRSPKGLIFVSNHRSQLDPVFVGAIFPFFSPLRPLFYMSLPAKEYYHLPLGRYLYGGILFKLFGAYPAYRGSGDYALVLRHHIELLARGQSVCIFPEGGISKDGTIQKAHRGVAYLAEHAGATLVPVAITGAKAIAVRIGAPFVWKGESAEEIMSHVRELQTHGA